MSTDSVNAGLARSNATRVLANDSSALVHMVDTPTPVHDATPHGSDQ